ncbi:MAG TPA: hypothetical protein VHA13_01495, partial [Gammaproteobacteria bacterium]|nr:hypothetical protein [Gammaproteobacteria bacterium]
MSKTLNNFLLLIEEKSCPLNFELNFGHEKFSPFEAKTLSAALASGKCTRGLKIVLSQCSLTVQSIESLNEGIANANCPEDLHVYLPQSSNLDVGLALTNMLMSGRCVKGLKLYLWDHEMGEEGAQIFSDALISGKCPADLLINLSGGYKNLLYDEGAFALAAALTSGRCPKGLQLIMASNTIMEKGAQALADALASGNCPEGLEIGLNENFIGSTGIMAFASALASGKCPKGLKLDLSANEIDDDGIEALATSLATGNCPQDLWIDLESNRFKKRGLEALIKALECGKCAQGLKININSITNNNLSNTIEMLLRKNEIKHSALACITFQQGLSQENSGLRVFPHDLASSIYQYLPPTALNEGEEKNYL